MSAVNDETAMQQTEQLKKYESSFRSLAIDMDVQNSKEKPQAESASFEGLIKREWEIINELQRMLKDPDLTVAEKTRVATVFAFHANTLNNLLTKKGEKDPFDDQNLGDYVRGVEPRVARRVRRDFMIWKRTFSFRK